MGSLYSLPLLIVTPAAPRRSPYPDNALFSNQERGMQRIAVGIVGFCGEASYIHYPFISTKLLKEANSAIAMLAQTQFELDKVCPSNFRSTD